MRALVAALAFTITFNLFAADTKILHITVDISKSYGEIFANFDKHGDIVDFRWAIHHADEPSEGERFTVEDLRNGTVFKEGSMKKFVKMRSENFSREMGGTVILDVPRNILTGSRTRQDLDYDRVQSAWEFSSQSFEDVRHVELAVKRLLGIPVGVNQINYIEYRRRR